MEERINHDARTDIFPKKHGRCPKSGNVAVYAPPFPGCMHAEAFYSSRLCSFPASSPFLRCIIQRM